MANPPFPVGVRMALIPHVMAINSSVMNKIPPATREDSIDFEAGIVDPAFVPVCGVREAI